MTDETDPMRDRWQSPVGMRFKPDKRRTRHPHLPPPVRQVDPDATPERVAQALLRNRNSRARLGDAAK
ncbi:MAG: hypothetical protein OXG57_00495 [Acidimicrobiaceae bacterium]|nr:hypothetical protein [Acidimicrobiaceae bacterium]